MRKLLATSIRCFAATTVAVILATSAAGTARAEPDFSRYVASHGIPICPDAKEGDTWYYLPNDLAIRKGADGRPALRFVMMRYTGTAAAGDQGKIRHRNILQFDVAMASRSADSLARAKADLQRAHRRLSFVPLPIRRVDALVNYTSAGDTTDVRLGRADIESNSSKNDGASGSFWQERTFTLSVDNETAELFEQSLRKGMLTLSVGYAFYSRGKVEGAPDFSGSGASVSGSGVSASSRVSGAARFQEMIDAILAESRTDSTGSEAMAHAGAFAVEVDSSDYNRCVKQIDINESVPPGYSVLSIYDYDFNNQIRPDLFEKMIEIEAVGAGGGRVQTSAEFRFDQPEIYRRSVRFRYAVQMGQPYRYRVHEIDQNGGESVSGWVSVRDWTPILDVTTRGSNANAGP